MVPLQARVAPSRRAAVMIHKEGPAGLRVYLHLPARGQRLPLAPASPLRLHHQGGGRVSGRAHGKCAARKGSGEQGVDCEGRRAACEALELVEAGTTASWAMHRRVSQMNDPSRPGTFIAPRGKGGDTEGGGSVWK